MTVLKIKRQKTQKVCKINVDSLTKIHKESIRNNKSTLKSQQRIKNGISMFLLKKLIRLF